MQLQRLSLIERADGEHTLKPLFLNPHHVISVREIRPIDVCVTHPAYSYKGEITEVQMSTGLVYYIGESVMDVVRRLEAERSEGGLKWPA